MKEKGSDWHYMAPQGWGVAEGYRVAGVIRLKHHPARCPGLLTRVTLSNKMEKKNKTEQIKSKK
jgi:hypothetical protein